MYYLGFGNKKKSEGIAVSYEKNENGDNFQIMFYISLRMAQISWTSRRPYFLKEVTCSYLKKKSTKKEQRQQQIEIVHSFCSVGNTKHEDTKIEKQFITLKS